ncbi:unnamed protein product [Larinioides sclopetarius]|uniref:Ribosomal protein S14 n=1 Tax=Larinioides sclopetarius TaxID=280406 RepID=A0AAV2AB12_9ARAC
MALAKRYTLHRYSSQKSPDSHWRAIQDLCCARGTTQRIPSIQQF